ncbi:hypothetical protein D0Z08_21325 [Nocardioides immobilis]|uniref:Uncharacterized protein n=1 Tax=Nocardioides immobilis TaxID=2049295 RepID=A0A417XXL9_9ACTN|nr:hypothetical protein [Nocardioides immobilis]RHW24990.1 hypothetical protein D0Z08_21325 [Nocardioides immobilis]
MLSFPLLRWLWATAAVVIAGHVVSLVVWPEYVIRDNSIPRQFDLNGEGNFASWFQSFPLLICALLTLLIAAHYRGQLSPLAGRWVAASALFLFMAVDEASQLHDLFTGPLRGGLEIDFGVFYFAWLLPAVCFLAFCAWYFAPLALSLPGVARNRLLGALAVYFGGAIVVEMISGFAVEHGRRSTPYLAVLTFEEICELAGVLLVVGALVALLRTVQPRTTIALLSDGGTIGLTPGAPASLPTEPRAEQLP